uniref:Ig-like domain-containing protein n=1 Tax=Equus caballus TaxID=9796 RepID=A0A3Q2HMU4_HORSE
MQKPHFRLCSNKATGPPSSSDTTKACQVAGRTRAISQGRRAPRMQPRRLALLCTVLAFICFGSSNTQSVYQAANVMSAQVGESVTLDCKITVSYTYYNMYWYRQLSSGEMTHIIRLYSANRNSREGRYSVVFQKPTLTLTISALTPGDSAVYFCAVAQASHSEASDGKSLTKTPRAQYKPAAPPGAWKRTTHRTGKG